MINNYLNPYNPYQYNSNLYQQVSQQQIPQTNVNWIRVNDVESTKNQMVQPNNQIWMMNTNEPIFYVKSADALGVATLKAYKFEEISIDGEVKNKVSDIDLNEYVKRNDLEKIVETKVKEIIRELKGAKNNGKSSNESNE